MKFDDFIQFTQTWILRIVAICVFILLARNFSRAQGPMDSIARPGFQYWYQVPSFYQNGRTDAFTKVLDSLNNPIALEEPTFRLNEFWDIRFETSPVWQDPTIHQNGNGNSLPCVLWLARENEDGSTYMTKLSGQLLFSYKELVLFEIHEGTAIPFNRPGRLILSKDPNKQFMLFTKWVSIDLQRFEIQHYYGNPDQFDWAGFIWHEQQVRRLEERRRKKW